MTITLELNSGLEKQLRDSFARGDSETAKTLLGESFAPAVKELLEGCLTTLSDAEFELLADQLADEFSDLVGSDAACLSDDRLN